MAVGNTFGATALSSYGGFWISYGIIFTPGGFNIIENIKEANGITGVNNVTGFWLMVYCSFVPYIHVNPVANAIFNLVLVDFHHSLPCLHLQDKHRLRPPFLHSRSRVLVPWSWPPYRIRPREALYTSHQDWRFLWYLGCSARLVLCPRWNGRLKKQLYQVPAWTSAMDG